jgi:hypothetical protein
MKAEESPRRGERSIKRSMRIRRKSISRRVSWTIAKGISRSRSGNRSVNGSRTKKNRSAKLWNPYLGEPLPYIWYARVAPFGGHISGQSLVQTRRGTACLYKCGRKCVYVIWRMCARGGCPWVWCGCVGWFKVGFIWGVGFIFVWWVLSCVGVGCCWVSWGTFFVCFVCLE